MSQKSAWFVLPTSVPGTPQVAPLPTALARSGVLRLRKVDEFIESWVQLTISGPAVTDEDPTITVDLSNGEFTSQVAAETAGNWTLNMGDSGLTAGAITWVSATQATIATTGTCTAGTISVMVEAAALSTGYDSGVASYDTEAETSTCTSEPELFFASKIDVSDVNPTMDVYVNNDVFLSPTACETLTNWDIDAGDTALELVSVAYLDDRKARLTFSGTAAAGTLTVGVLASAMMGETTPETAYTITAAAWTNPGTWTQEALEGTVEVFQSESSSDLPFFCYEYSCPTGCDNRANINLINSGSAWTPKMWTSFVYDPGNAEGSDIIVYAQTVLDI